MFSFRKFTDIFGLNWHVKGEDVGKLLSYREISGDPAGVLVPDFVGQAAFDAATGLWYVASGETSADWGQQVDRSQAVDLARRNGRPQIVATRGVMPGTVITGTYSLTEISYDVKFGPSPVSGVQFVFGGGFSVATNGTSGESALANDVTYVAALEKVSPSKVVRATVNGQLVVVAKAGAGLLVSDPIGLDFDAGEIAKVQCEQRVVVGEAYTAATGMLGDLLGYRSTSLSTGQVGTAEALWVATGRSTSPNVATITAVIGYPEEPYPCAVIMGDSVANSRDDVTADDGFGNNGYIARGLYAGGPDGVAIPYCRIAQSGNRVSQITDQLTPNSMRVLDYASHCVIHIGTNDVSAGTTFAALQALYLKLWARIRARGVKVSQCHILPRTTGAWTLADGSDQTGYATGFAPGGVRDQLNAWFTEMVAAGYLDGEIDPNPYITLPGDPNKWNATGAVGYYTDDGIHPETPAHVAMAPAVSAASVTWTV